MFNINGEEWQIMAVQPNHYSLFRPDGSLSVAACDDYTKTIYVSNQLYGPFLKKVLCHEITHAAMFSYNVYLDYTQEELIANIISTYGDEIISITNKVFKKIDGIL